MHFDVVYTEERRYVQTVLTDVVGLDGEYHTRYLSQRRKVETGPRSEYLFPFGQAEGSRGGLRSRGIVPRDDEVDPKRLFVLFFSYARMRHTIVIGLVRIGHLGGNVPVRRTR